jgi:hypothetical protein
MGLLSSVNWRKKEVRKKERKTTGMAKEALSLLGDAAVLHN